MRSASTGSLTFIHDPTMTQTTHDRHTHTLENEKRNANTAPKTSRTQQVSSAGKRYDCGDSDWDSDSCFGGCGEGFCGGKGALAARATSRISNQACTRWLIASYLFRFVYAFHKAEGLFGVGQHFRRLSIPPHRALRLVSSGNLYIFRIHFSAIRSGRATRNFTHIYCASWTYGDVHYFTFPI